MSPLGLTVPTKFARLAGLTLLLMGLPGRAAVAQAGARALTADDVITVLETADFDEEMRIAFIEEECISFRLDDVNTARLRGAGATPAVVSAIRGACYVEPSRIFDIDLSQQVSGLAPLNSANCAYSFVGGGFRIESVGGRACHTYRLAYPDENVRVAATFKTLAADPSGAGGGLMFGWKPDRSAYGVVLLADSRLKLLHYDGPTGAWSTVREVRPPAVRGLNTTNQLAVELRGLTAIFLVNGVPVLSHQLLEPQPGLMTVFANPGVVVFDRVSAVRLAP